MTLINLLMVVIVGYLFGCIQSSYLIAKFIKKIDIREHGNSNAGASNTTIVLGWKYGIIVALIDIFKATVSVLLIGYILKDSGLDNETLTTLLFLNGAFVVLGHNYPFFLKFKGGKGTASLVGMFIALDWKMALICIAAIVIMTVLTNYIALGTILMMVSFSTVTYLFSDFGTGAFIVALGLTVLSTYNHLENVKRIIKKEETGLRDTMNKKK